GGGSQSFDQFNLGPLDTANANGVFAIATSVPANNSQVTGSIAKVSGSSGTIYIVASGNEVGDDGTNPVKVYAKVTQDSIATKLMN
ncbi:MAG TPA: hypothetical protein PLG66_21800, partial [Calditrichia bacterium]|nr:hypothetical protein [Calditrichia bacterium]